MKSERSYLMVIGFAFPSAFCLCLQLTNTFTSKIKVKCYQINEVLSNILKILAPTLKENKKTYVVKFV